ncbi:E3 ubiquitin-protein ligase Mdm2-like isoform X2 [Ornithodoros turicata]
MKDGLLEILSTVGAKPAPTPISEVMQLMKAYIIKHRLYDSSRPAEILCENNPMGTLFGVPSFLIKETFKYLARNLFRVPAQAVSQAQKRDAPSTSTAEESANKRLCPEPPSKPIQVHQGPPPSPTFLGFPDSPKYDSASETACSLQGYETAYVKDTSDECWYSDEKYGGTVSSLDDSDTDSPYELEFEVESADERKMNCYSSASEVEDTGLAGIVLCLKDEDCGFWADFSDFDSESSESVYDSEIGEDDLWQCRMCKTRNTPLQRYCQKCWKERFGWLPNRSDKHPPQRKRYRKRKERHAKKKGMIARDKQEEKRATSESQEASLHGSTPELSSQEAQLPAVEAAPEASHSCISLLSKSVDVQKAGSSQEPSDSPTFLSSQDSTQASVGVCNICLLRPKCGIIVHGRTSHRFSCYKCARQLMELEQPCPVCRRTIQRVTRNFDV